MRSVLPRLGAAIVLGVAPLAAPCAAQASTAEQEAIHAPSADARRTIRAYADTLTVEVSNLPTDAGHVLLYLFDASGKFGHDKNDDGKFNTGLFGRPKEPFAFSSGAKNHGFSRPSFADASFDVNAPAAKATVTF